MAAFLSTVHLLLHDHTHNSYKLLLRGSLYSQYISFICAVREASRSKSNNFRNNYFFNIFNRNSKDVLIYDACKIYGKRWGESRLLLYLLWNMQGLIKSSNINYKLLLKKKLTEHQRRFQQGLSKGEAIHQGGHRTEAENDSLGWVFPVSLHNVENLNICIETQGSKVKWNVARALAWRHLMYQMSDK